MGARPAPRIAFGLRCVLRVVAAAAAVLAGAAPALAAPSRVRAQVPGDPPVSVDADAIDFAADLTVTARGSVVVSSRDDTLRADAIRYNPATGEVSATGNVHASGPQGEVRAESLVLNLRTRAASALQTRVSVPAPGRPDVTYYAAGASLGGTRGEYRLENGFFTTCGFTRPSWAVRAREIVLRPGQQVVGRGIGLDLFGQRLFTVPRLSFGLGEGEEAPLIPRLVGGARDTLGVRGDFRFGTRCCLPGAGYAVLSAKHIVRGGLGVSSLGDVPVGIRAGFKEDATSRFLSGLTVTDIPAISFFLPESVGPRQGAFQVGLPQPISPVATLAGDVVGGRWQPGRRFRFLAAGSAGRFIAHPTETTANRLNLAAALEASPVPVLPRVGLGAALRGRWAAYSHSEPYAVAAPELSLQWQPSRADTLAATWRSYETRGQTPFFFDRIDSPRSLQLDWARRTTQYGLTTQVLYDLTHGSVYGWEVGYSQRLHCLQPGVVVRRRGDDTSFGLTLEIPGVGGGA